MITQFGAAYGIAFQNVSKAIVYIGHWQLDIICKEDGIEISSSSDNFDELIENLNTYLNNIWEWLSKNKLKHHSRKSKATLLRI